MSLPAARIGDLHVCPMVTPGLPPIPHVGGPIIGPGVPTVMVGGLPQAKLGDQCTCVGPPAPILKGSSGVFVGNMPAARMGDNTGHGGAIAKGQPNVLIGEVNAALLTPPNIAIILEAINPTNSVINCGNIIDSVIGLQRGNAPLEASAGRDGVYAQINQRLGTNVDFSSPTNLNTVFSQLQASGPGSMQVIGIDYGDGGGGHVVVAQNVNGTVGIMEGQNWGPGQESGFITDPAVANARYNPSGTTTYAASPVP